MAKSVSAAKYEKALNRVKNANKRAREGRSEMRRRATLGASAFALGKLESSGMLARLPTVLGMPRTMVAGIVAGVGGQFVGGIAGDILDGIADSAIAVVGYQWGKGQEVAGDPGPLYDPATARVLRDSPGIAPPHLVAGSGDPELDALEEAVEGFEVAAAGGYDDDLVDDEG